MIRDSIDGVLYVRYPGAVFTDPETNTTRVRIPLVSHDAGGAEVIDCCREVLEGEIIDQAGGRSIRVTINYPYQAAMLSSFPTLQPGAVSNIVDDEDFAVYEAGDIDAAAVESQFPYTTYSGPSGLGGQLAFGRTVRPFRKVFSLDAVEAVRSMQ
jgi:hypothetical protein